MNTRSSRKLPVARNVYQYPMSGGEAGADCCYLGRAHEKSLRDSRHTRYKNVEESNLILKRR